MNPALAQSALRTPLNAILGNQTQVRVLRELFRHGGELAATRIARDAKVSPYGARLALAALAGGTGLVEVLGSGRSILYRADRRHPLSKVLAALFRVEQERVDAVFTTIKDAVEDDGIMAAWMYGSFARGEDEPGSDLDIVVVTAADGGDAANRVRERLARAAGTLRFSPSVVGLDLADAVRLSGGGDP